MCILLDTNNGCWCLRFYSYLVGRTIYRGGWLWLLFISFLYKKRLLQFRRTTGCTGDAASQVRGRSLLMKKIINCIVNKNYLFATGFCCDLNIKTIHFGSQ